MTRPTTTRDEEFLRRGKLTFELFEVAVQIQRQNLRRGDPAASDEEIDRRVQEWLLERPGAEHGDAEGVPGHRFDDLVGRCSSSPRR